MSILSAVINTASASAVEIVPAVAGMLVRVTHFNFEAGGSTTVTFTSGSGGTAKTGPYPQTAQTGIAAGNGAKGLFETAIGSGLFITNAAAVQVSGLVTYEYASF